VTGHHGGYDEIASVCPAYPHCGGIRVVAHALCRPSYAPASCSAPKKPAGRIPGPAVYLNH
jgi:hypothetical protein